MKKIILTAILFLVSPFAALAHMFSENGDYSNMMGFGGGWMWVGMSFAWIIAVLLIVLLVVVIIKLLKK